MGQDGYSLIANINEGNPRWTGKDPAWLLYALGTYGLSHRIEALVLPLLVIHIFIFTRIIGYMYIQGWRKTAVFSLAFIACAPHVLNYSSSLYADSVFSLSFIGILFEIWLALKNKKAHPHNIAIIAILTPIAVFFKGNGIIALLPIAYLTYKLSGFQRVFIITTTLGCAIAISIGGKTENLGKGHGALEPLILFETVNFMQSKPMNLWETRHMVTEKTKEIMYRYISQEDIDKYYDRDYWDTLWHLNQDRIRFRQMSREDIRHLRTEFFKYNLWRNLPAFISSRVNIFMASALAQGGIIPPNNSKHTINLVETKTEYNPLHLSTLPNAVDKIFHFSLEWRYIFWSPLLGLALLSVCIKKSRHLNDHYSLIIALTLLTQLGGIFLFSIAAEYRYLLVLFYAPLLLFPMVYSMGRD